MVLWYICFVLDVHGSFFFTSNYYICPSFSLPPSRSSHTGLHSRLCSPPSHNGSCLAFFTARRFQLSIPSSTQVELCLPTLGGLSSCLFFFIFFFFFHPIYYLRPSVLSLLVATQIWGHITGSSPPYQLRFVPCIFIARRIQPFLPSSTRVGLCFYPR